jgi:hypothetical protein
MAIVAAAPAQAHRDSSLGSIVCDRVADSRAIEVMAIEAVAILPGEV